jgi:hypothetical protein
MRVLKVLAAALAVALLVHQRQATATTKPSGVLHAYGPTSLPTYRYRPAWDDPVVVFTAISGIGVAAAILVTARSQPRLQAAHG